jgi:hypothetical protein
MMGGGFLKQGQDSFEKNRAIKNNALKGSFDKSIYASKSKDSLSENDPKMSDNDRKALILKIRDENRRVRILMFGIVLCMLISLFTFFLFG